MKIQSTDETIQAVLQSHYYRIPNFQREYSWVNEQVDEFWEDILTSNSSDYFIGSMVVFDDENDLRGVVDGQQRLTTITLILAALRNTFREAGYDNLANGLHQFIERADVNFNMQYIIQPETSYPFFQEYIQRASAPRIRAEIGDEEKKLESAYNRIKKLISKEVEKIEKEYADSPDLTDKISSKLQYIRKLILNLKVIIIELDDEADAYTVFETLNTRGMDLQVQDLVKSLLIQLLNNPSENRNVDITKEKWNAIRKNINDTKAGQRASMKDFLYDYWLIHYSYISTSKLYKSIKESTTEANAGNYLESLLQSSSIYRLIFAPNNKRWERDERQIEWALQAYEIFGVRQHMPLVLALFSEYDKGNINRKMLQKALIALEKFLFIFTAIVSERANKAPKKFYASHAREILKEDDKAKKGSLIDTFIKELRKRIPPFEDFDNAFQELQYTSKNTRQRALLHYILSSIDRDKQSMIFDYEALNIEHIAPQKPDDGSDPITLVGNIGNLIIAAPKYNAEVLKNKAFSEKKPLLLDSHAWIDDVLKNNAEWSNEEIKTRAKLLSKLAYDEVWKI